MLSFLPPPSPDEYDAVGDLARHLSWDDGRAARVIASATDLMQRSTLAPREAGAIQEFLTQFPLSTPEGVALVALAEALLRVPDTATANDLITDKITAAAWLDRQVQTTDWLVRAARYGLSLTKTLLDSLAASLAAPIIRTATLTAIRQLGSQFVLGETIDQGIVNAQGAMRQGYAVSFDMLGEGARTLDQADHYFAAYENAVTRLAAARDLIPATLHHRCGLSVKLSALHPRFNPLQADRCLPVLVDRLIHLASLCRRYHLTLTMDAEETERLSLSLDILTQLLKSQDLVGWHGLGLAVQAYQKCAPALVDHVLDLARTTHHRLRIRLVKGAYWDTEIKRAQILGLKDYPVWTRKDNTDLSYLVCAQKLLAAGDDVYPMFATHNAHTVAAVLDLASGRDMDSFELQRLHGMGAPLHDVVVREGRAASTIYAPIGTYGDLLAYLVRRMLENGANTSFVHQSAHAAASALTDPYANATTHATRRHREIPLPPQLFKDRDNSVGYDITDPRDRCALHPLRPVSVPTTRVASDADITQAVARAHLAFPGWNTTPVRARADILRRFAHILHDHTPHLIHLLQLEGQKTLADAVAELREAIDFARYYAARADQDMPMDGQLLPGPTGEENRLYLEGRGVFACISPWNFPLAIFVGQIAAALVAGNTVVAKPAEQTPGIAAVTVDLFHQAGVPPDAMILVVGDGTTGARLVAHPLIAGVAFTGSTTAARAINRSLAAKDGPIVPLIAETGGQNAMIVDSTALLETAVDDIVASAFLSAGQRCSALRVLCVQQDVADPLLKFLTGAVALLRVGDPLDPATDVGPVIDADAHHRLTEHEKFLNHMGARLVARAPLSPSLSGHYFAPVAYEIPGIHVLKDEVFGPVLHIIRYAARDLSMIMDGIQQTGFGLTFGIQSRLSTRTITLAQQVRAGNVYVNRSMTGAVVGVQPFGGQGLSGTGPKAGGPHYLARFTTERTVTINTAAAGGNIALVAGGD